MTDRRHTTALAAGLLALTAACADKSSDDDDATGALEDDCRGVGECGQDDEASGGGWSAGTDSGESDGAAPAGDAESCDFVGLGLCVDVVDYPETEAWCRDLQSTYGLDVVYTADPCPEATRLTCDTTEVGGDFPVGAGAVYAHYYESHFSRSDAERICADIGGVPVD